MSLKNTKAVLHEQLVCCCFVIAESGHGEHCAAFVREYVLLVQVLHAPSPALALNVPGVHPTHFPTDLVYAAAHTHAVAMLISLFPHKTIVPSLSEIGRVVRSTSCNIGNAIVVLATAANVSALVDMMMMSTRTPDSCSRFLEVVVKMTCTKSSEMLYCNAMLLMRSRIISSKFADEEVFVEFDSSTRTKPLSLRPSL